MANIANLVVKISANSAQLKRGLSRATTAVNRFGEQAARRIGVGLKRAFIAASAAAVGFGLLISKGAANLDKLAKTSTKLGLTVSQLQELQFAAKLSGVSTETLNMALQRMVRRIAEAGQGTGEAVKALKELNLDAARLTKLRPDQQFAAISTAFKGIGAQGDKVRLAMKLFDSEGVSLVNTLGLNLGAVGLEFSRLGVSISQQQARAAEAFTDTATKLGLVWSSFIMQLSSEVAPAFDGLLQKIVDNIKEMGGLGEVAKTVANTIVTALNKVVFAATKMGEVLDRALNFKDRLQLGAGRINEIFARAGNAVVQTFGSEEAKRNSNRAMQGIINSQDNIANRIQNRGLGGIGGVSSRATNSISNGSKITVSIIADKGVIVDAVVTDDKFDRIVAEVARRTATNAARQVAR